MALIWNPSLAAIFDSEAATSALQPSKWPILPRSVTKRRIFVLMLLQPTDLLSTLLQVTDFVKIFDSSDGSCQDQSVRELLWSCNQQQLQLWSSESSSKIQELVFKSRSGKQVWKWLIWPVIGHLQAVFGWSSTTLKKMYHCFSVQHMVWRLIPGQISPENNGGKEALSRPILKNKVTIFFLPKTIPP